MNEPLATLTEVGDGCLAYLQGDGGWGWSNAGLIVGDGTSLLVDTLFDLRLTQEMLDAIDPQDLVKAVAENVLDHLRDAVRRGKGK